MVIIAIPPIKNVNGIAYYIAPGGTGDGLTEATPMSDSDLLATVLSGNDFLHFERGGEYIIGDYQIPSTTITAYGAGADPIIGGGTSISGLVWTDEGGGIFSTPMVTEPKWVWINGECAKLAETARIIITNRPSQTQITVTHADVSGYTSIVGSYLVVKETDFKQSQRVTVTAYDGAGVITVGGRIPTANNVDLVLYNNTEYLTGNNEWAWESGTLYVRAAASPSTMDIRSTDYTYGFKVNGRVNVDNIEFKEYYTAAIWVNGGIPNISDCNFHDIRDDAVLIQTAVTGGSITNSLFTRIGNNGVFTRPMTNFVVTGNTFTDIGMQENYHWQTWSDGDGSIAINNVQGGGSAFMYNIDLRDDTIDGSNLTFNDNTITNVAYCGVNLGLSTGNTFLRNIITSVTNRFNDGGGIYVFHYREYSVVNDNNEIANNFISNASGTPSGTIATGIYIDNRTANTNIHHNTIENCPWGITLNLDTYGHTVEDNNIIGCSEYAMVIRQGDNGTNIFDNDGITFNRNVMAVTTTGAKCMLFDIQGSYPAWNPYSDGGGADNNYYIKNITPSASVIADSDNMGANLTLATLRTAYGQDVNSVAQLFNPILVENQTNTVSNEDADSYFKDLDGVALEAYTIDPMYSRIIAELNYSNTLAAASTQYFSAGTTADIQFIHTDPFTISLWFKITNNPGAVISLIDNRVATGRGYAVQMLTSGFIQVRFVNTNTTNLCTLTDDVDLADNAWHHLLVTKAASVGLSVLYIDGVSASPTIANSLTATILSADPLTIGRNNGSGLTADMWVDAVAIWPSNMSPSVTTIRNGGREIDLRTIGITHPLHYWRMGLPNSLLDVGTSGTPLNLTGVNSPGTSTDAP